MGDLILIASILLIAFGAFMLGNRWQEEPKMLYIDKVKDKLVAYYQDGNTVYLCHRGYVTEFSQCKNAIETSSLLTRLSKGEDIILDFVYDYVNGVYVPANEKQKLVDDTDDLY